MAAISRYLAGIVKDVKKLDGVYIHRSEAPGGFEPVPAGAWGG
jgi:hypothetical protein